MLPEEVGRSISISPKVLAFHKLTPGFSFGVTNYSPTRFGRLLCFLQDHEFSFCKIDEPTPNVAISFDDGYEHLIDQLPALIDKYGITPTIFVPTAWIGQPNRWDYSHLFRPVQHMSRQSIRRLADLGVRFGSHGHTHNDLISRSDQQLHHELADSRKILEDLTGQEINSLSYPFGRYNRRVIDIALGIGYRCGFTMEFPSPHDKPMTTGRIAVYGYDTNLSVLRKLASGPWYGMERLKAGITNRLSIGTVLLNRLRGHTSSLDSAMDS